MASVVELWRYPVKSMMGERLERATLTDAGLLGDRGWAVRDEVRGGIRGAKKIGSLMTLGATYTAEPSVAEPTPTVRISLPDGSAVLSDEADVDRRVSQALDHEITLWPLQPATDLDHYRRGAADSDDIMVELRDLFDREESEPLPDLGLFPPEILEFESPPGTYLDAYPLLVLTTTSLRSLQALAPASKVDIRRFRPNVVLDLGDDDQPGEFPEAGWSGRRLRLGATELECVCPCPRCVMITRPFADLPQDRALMRTVVAHADQNLGVYARVVTPGDVAVGAEATLV